MFLMQRRSSSSDSWCGLKLRTESSQGRSAGAAATPPASPPAFILQAVELQGHEQQMRTDRRDALLHALVEPPDFGIVAFGCEQQLGVREGPTCSILERLVALDQAGEAGAVDLRQATLVLGLECDSVGCAVVRSA